MFRPCRSSRLRRFAPHWHPAGLLHPAADHGVRTVFSLEQPVPASGTAYPELSPVTQYPSKLSPRLQPHRVTAAVALSSFHAPGFPKPVRCRTSVGRLGSRPTSRLCSTTESVAAPGVSTEAPLDAPLGLYPQGGPDRVVLAALQGGRVRTFKLSFSREERPDDGPEGTASAEHVDASGWKPAAYPAFQSQLRPEAMLRL
jgi:hypothetical protein